MNAAKILSALGLILVMNSCKNTETTVVKVPVGMAVSLTGSFSPYGITQTNGLELAFNELNVGGLIPGVEIVPYLMDDKSSPDTCRKVFRELINTYKVLAIIGPTSSNSAFAADTIAQNHQVVVMGISNTVPGITEMGNFVFRNSLSESAVIPNTIRLTHSKLGYSKVAIIYGDDDSYTIGAYNAFKTSLDSVTGVTIVSTETIHKGDQYFTGQLNRVKASEPDVIVLAALVSEAAAIMVQARQMGIPTGVRFIGGNSFNSSQLWQLAGEAAQGAICGSAWIHSEDTPGNSQFVTDYWSIFGTKPDQFAAQAYAGLHILADAIRRCNPLNSENLRNELANTHNLPTVLGTFSFDGSRNPVHPPVIQELVNGEFIVFR